MTGPTQEEKVSKGLISPGNVKLIDKNNIHLYLLFVRFEKHEYVDVLTLFKCSNLYSCRCFDYCKSNCINLYYRLRQRNFTLT